MKNTRKRTDSLLLKEEAKKVISVIADAINDSNRELESLRIALSQRLPQGEQKEIDSRNIC